MVAGHLQEKRGYYHIVLNYNASEFGKKVRKTKWLSTGLEVKGNKKKAEALLMEARRSFEPKYDSNDTDKLLFADYLSQWVESVKPNIVLQTYASYRSMADAIICPYFRDRKITLRDLQARDIQEFYTKRLSEGVTANTCLHYHAIIRKSLKHAVKMEMIPNNVADSVERPKKKPFVGSFYDVDELNRLMPLIIDPHMKLAVSLAAFYGLRRSEIVGLGWDAINFEQKTITIFRTAHECFIDGKLHRTIEERTKSKASLRTLPLVGEFEELLRGRKADQEEQRLVCGNCYNKEHIGLIMVNELGELMKPNYLSSGFRNLLKKHKLRVIRFHDLRHTCASLLIAEGVPIKDIQDWLGHSTYATTADIYAHLQYKSKISVANVMSGKGINLQSETAANPH